MATVLRRMEGSKPETKTPGDFLKAIKGKVVMVKLNSGVGYKGVLACLDGYMVRASEARDFCRNLAPPFASASLNFPFRKG